MRRRVYADDHALLEALGHLVGVPLGRCYYMSTAVIRVAVEEWVEALTEHPEFGEEVKRVLADPEYRRVKYEEARRANPHRRRVAEEYAIRQTIDRDERERKRLNDEAVAGERQRAVEGGKMKILRPKKSRAEPTG